MKQYVLNVRTSIVIAIILKGNQILIKVSIWPLTDSLNCYLRDQQLFIICRFWDTSTIASGLDLYIIILSIKVPIWALLDIFNYCPVSFKNFSVLSLLRVPLWVGFDINRYIHAFASFYFLYFAFSSIELSLLGAANGFSISVLNIHDV